MGSSVSVAVVIVTYNNLATTLTACLDALAKQTLLPTRTIVIDNASPTGFPDDSLTGRRDIEFIQNSINLGFAGANNQAFELLERDVNIELVALLNPDARPEPEWLEALVDAAQRHPDFDAFASRMMLAGTDNVVDGLGDEYHVCGLAWRGFHGERLRPEHLIEREVFGVCAGGGLYRLRAVNEIGGFDADLFCYLEDVDLSFRLRRVGKRCRYVPGAVVWHMGGESTRDNLTFRLYYGHRNMIRVYLKNMPTPLLLLTLPAHIAVNLIGLVRSLWRGDFAIVLRAKLDAAREIDAVVAQRRQLQRTASAGSRRLWPHMSKALWRNIAKTR
jgi:GT2 family glycosyltransferase